MVRRIIILLYILSFSQVAYAFDPFQKPKKVSSHSPVPSVVQQRRPVSPKLPDKSFKSPKPHWEKPEDREEEFQILGKIKNKYIVAIGRNERQRKVFFWEDGKKRNNCIIKDWRIICYEKRIY